MILPLIFLPCSAAAFYQHWLVLHKKLRGCCPIRVSTLKPSLREDFVWNHDQKGWRWGCSWLFMTVLPKTHSNPMDSRLLQGEVSTIHPMCRSGHSCAWKQSPAVMASSWMRPIFEAPQELYLVQFGFKYRDAKCYVATAHSLFSQKRSKLSPRLDRLVGHTCLALTASCFTPFHAMEREILLSQFATAEPRWHTVEFRRKTGHLQSIEQLPSDWYNCILYIYTYMFIYS